MGDVNSIIADPYKPNVLSNMYAINQMNALQKDWDAQAAMKAAGPLAAAGDYEEAQKSLLGAGQTDLAEKIRDYGVAVHKQARQLDDEKLLDATKTHTMLGNAAVYADTPDKWMQVVAAARRAGLNTTGYENFTTGRPAVLALSGQASKILEAEKERRDEFRKDLSGGTIREGTQKSPTGAEQSGLISLGAGPDGQPIYKFSPYPEGLDVGEPLTGKSSATTSAKVTDFAATREAAKAQYANLYPDKPALDDALASFAAAKIKAGNAIVGWEHDANGRPLKPVYGEEQKAAAALQPIDRIQKDFKDAYGKDLPFVYADTAHRYGLVPYKKDDDSVGFIVPKHTPQDVNEQKLALQQNTSTPTYVQNKASAQEIGKIEGQAKAFKDQYSALYPGRQPLPDALAQYAVFRNKAGDEIIGWEHDANGVPTKPIYGEKKEAAQKGNSAAFAVINGIRGDYKTKYGIDLPYTAASEAYRTGANRVEQGTDGQPVPVYSDNSPQKIRERQLALKERVLNPDYTYNQSFSQKAAATDVGVAARKQLGEVVDDHVAQLKQIASRPDFDTALEFLHTGIGSNYWAGRYANTSEIPRTVIDLKQAVNSVTGEYVNFVGAAHKGAVSEHEDAIIRGIGQSLYDAPDATTFKHNLDNIKDLAKAFQRVKFIGAHPQGATQAAPAGTPSSSTSGITVTPASPTNPTSALKAAPSDVLDRARGAIGQGASRDAVIKKLNDNGYDASGL